MWKGSLDHHTIANTATLLPSPCKRTTGRPSPPPRRPLHALCKECDYRRRCVMYWGFRFNPRALLAECDANVGKIPRASWFQSTHSLRSATTYHLNQRGYDPVSIHALLAECDREPDSCLENPKCFNPRTPCGVRLGGISFGTPDNRFQSTHSLRSATSALSLPYSP